MSMLNSNSGQCARLRGHLDAYLDHELSEETANDLRRHLETCPNCARELEARARLRHALRRAARNQVPSLELRRSIEQRLREMPRGWFGGSPRLAWAAALAGLLAVLLGSVATEQWISILKGRRIVAAVLALGVSDHIQCAIRGHNYPETPNPPELLRQKLGPEYAGLLEVVQRKLPGFELLEAHICSIPGSSRKYVHFITRGRGTILSVILTRSQGAQLPSGIALRAGTSGGLSLYAAHLEGMNAAGFESNGYFGFVVSDLSRDANLHIAAELAPPVKAALEQARAAGNTPPAQTAPAI
jgi:anti-sigma factor (TIGR02949 family)